MTGRHDHIAEFLRAAAFLRREFLGRNLGEDQTRSRREKTIFLFDTDIIITYCAPWQTGPRREGGGDGYGDIFPRRSDTFDGHTENEDSIHQSPEEREAYTASILARHVFEKVRPYPLPTYQFAPHFRETTTIYENARRFHDVAKGREAATLGRMQHERLRHAAALISHHAKESRSNLVLPLAEELLQRMSPLGFPKEKSKRQILEWERFLELSSMTGGIFPQRLVPAHVGKLDLGEEEKKKLSEALSLLTEMPENLKETHAQLARVFLSRLGRDGRPEQMETDATSIATLALLNDSLLRADTGWRAVFVTGSHRIVEACYGNFPAIAGISDEIEKQFSQKFVRHLWAYTTEALLEPDLRDNPTKFINWLDGLLAKWSGAIEFDESELTEIILRPTYHQSNVSSDNTESALQQWENLTEGAITRYRLGTIGVDHDESERLKQRIVRQVIRGKSGPKPASWDEVIEDISEEVHRAKDRTFLRFSEIGKNALVAQHAIEKRNPPDLAFGSLTSTNTIFQKLCSPIPYSMDDYIRDLEKIAGDCHDPSIDGDDRQLTHLRFLVLGATFAAANKWGVALSQAKRAVSIIERSRANQRFWPIPVKPRSRNEPTSFMSGREAYFLCAGATRVIAKVEDDFDTSSAYVDKAEMALKEDKSQGTAAKSPFVRFKAERLAIALSRYYFRRFQKEQMAPARQTGSENLAEDWGTEYLCDDLVEEIYSAARTMLDGISEEILGGQLFGQSEVDLKKLGKITLVHIATNLIQVCAIRAFRASLSTPKDDPRFPLTRPDLELALKLLRNFVDEGENEKRVRKTPLIKLYQDSGARLLGDQEFSFVTGDYKLENLYSDLEEKNVSLYDPWRFKRLKQLAKKINAMNGRQRRALVFGNK